MTESVLAAFNLNDGLLEIKPFGTGLINNTWKVESRGKSYIFQKVNDKIFKRPEDIAKNIQLIVEYLHQYHPEYLFVSPVTVNGGEGMVFDKETGYYRLFPFISGSHSKDVLVAKEQAFEAARQFSMFTKKMSGFDTALLAETIHSFHDLSLRYSQFLQALDNGNLQRISECAGMIEYLKEQAAIVEVYEKIKKDPSFKKRVTHHDTKISNILFDDGDKGLCVIDLDTVMPGYFFSDVGDMMRTYLCPVSEEEVDFSKIEIRDEFYKAIVDGYYSEMKDELSEKEKKCFFFAGKFIIYMQALRFLTDYINNDIYYGAKYPEHNKVRAGNQLTLLERLIEKENELGNYMPD